MTNDELANLTRAWASCEAKYQALAFGIEPGKTNLGPVHSAFNVLVKARKILFLAAFDRPIDDSALADVLKSNTIEPPHWSDDLE